MKLLKNKIFAIIVCLISFIISGLIFSDRVFGVSVRSNMDMYSGKIINLGTPTNSNDAATKSYVDTAASSGGLWSDNGNYIYPKNASSIYVTDDNKIGIGSQPGTYDTLKVNGVGRFTESLSVGSQSYGSTGDVIASGIGQFGAVQSIGVLSVQGNAYLWRGADMSNSRIIRVASPTYSDDAATKSYVDSYTPSWNKLTGFPSSCSGGQYVSGVGSSLTCSVPSNSWTDSSSYTYLNRNSEFSIDNSGSLDMPGSLSVSGGGYSLAMVVDSDGIHMWSGDIRMWNGGHIYTTDLTAIGNVGIGTSPSYSNKLEVYGNVNIQGTLSASTKNFVIDHPLDPENKQLIHSSLEGPEIAVFYRGEAQLQNGKAEVVLPNYFEALTRKENRTVLLTPKFDSHEPISNLAASAVQNGRFSARAIDQNNPSQKFYWEVKAVRADIALLEVERLKTEKEKK